MMKMKKNVEMKEYEAPFLEVVHVEVESGFAGSQLQDFEGEEY